LGFLPGFLPPYEGLFVVTGAGVVVVVVDVVVVVVVVVVDVVVGVVVLTGSA